MMFKVGLNWLLGDAKLMMVLFLCVFLMRIEFLVGRLEQAEIGGRQNKSLL
jgi:hypothetical protein